MVLLFLLDNTSLLERLQLLGSRLIGEEIRYIHIYIYIKCKILTFVKQCSIHRSRAMYILGEEKDK